MLIRLHYFKCSFWTFSRNRSTEQSACGTRCNNCYYRVVSGEETDLDMPSNVVGNDTTTTLLKILAQPILKNIKVQVFGTALVLRAIELYVQWLIKRQTTPVSLLLVFRLF